MTGLEPDDFEVFEDGQPQDVSAFAAGEFPLTVALGVDRSWSMAGDRLRLAKRAAQSFLRELKPGDRSMVVAISSEAEVIAPLSTDRFTQARAIDALDPWSTTALHDAIIATLDRLEPEPGRQALVVFSDGADRYSKATAAEVIARARRSNALIYPIAFGRERPPLLAELADGHRRPLVPAARRQGAGEDARHDRARAAVSVSCSDTRRASRSSPACGSGDRSASSLKKAKAGTRVRARDGYTTDVNSNSQSDATTNLQGVSRCLSNVVHGLAH